MRKVFKEMHAHFRKLYAAFYALQVAMCAALLIWGAGIFINGEYYDFLDPGADLTRVYMLVMFVSAGLVAYGEKR
jgi:TRAP-type C4-dicarboxylate transport system permease small subunit